jgi:hypothetical protein
MASAFAVPESAEATAAEHAYGRVFTQLKRRGVQGLAVTQSVKLARGSVEANRYFVRFASTAADIEQAQECCRGLGFPMQAEPWVQTQLGGWAGLGAIGVARIRGEMHYRAYFRTGQERTGDIYVWAVEWSATSRSEHGRRQYRVLDLHTAEEMRGPLGDAMCLETEEERTVFENWLKLLAFSSDRNQLLEVRESNTGRLSYDAAPAFAEALTMDRMTPFWTAWCEAFGIDAAAYGAWWQSVAEGRIENTTFGRDGKGRLFVSLYFGTYEQPMPPQVFPALLRSKGLAASDANGVGSQEPKAGALVFAIGAIRVAPADPQDRNLSETLPPQGISLHAAGAAAEPVANLLQNSPEASKDLLWTLEVNGTPVYCLELDTEASEFALDGLHSFVRKMSVRQPSSAPESLPISAVGGRLTGESRMVNGLSVPMLKPDARSMFTWTPAGLMETMAEAEPPGLASALNLLRELAKRPGSEAGDRAMNFAATQPAALAPAFRAAADAGLQLARIAVAAHNVAIFGSDRIDVRFLFQLAKAPQSVAKLEAVLTVDVQETSPFCTGPVRLWERL